MHSLDDCIAARREGFHAARLGYPWDMNPFTQSGDALLRIEWHVGWWEGLRQVQTVRRRDGDDVPESRSDL